MTLYVTKSTRGGDMNNVSMRSHSAYPPLPFDFECREVSVLSVGLISSEA